jgi:hypothetical protein
MLSVIPEKEFAPRRLYRRDGATVSCYKIIMVKGTAMDPEYDLSKDPDWIMTFFDETHATNLINDLYFGEYTGA